jgi:hypothetical protein
MKTLLLSIFLCGFFANTAFGSILGDYKSNVNTTGNWTSISSWLYYNGSAWVAATNYPGQIAGTGDVLIQAGDTITMGQADLTTTMTTLTISGTLVLDGGNGGGLFTINTQSIIVTAGLTPYANIDFHSKVTLALLEDTTIQVGTGGLPTPGNGTCNNNIEISIGGHVLAYCTGTGSPPAEYNFSDLINNGGYYVVNASISPTYVCESGSFVMTATPLPSSGVTAINWYTVPSGGSSISSSNPYTTPIISTTTTYYVEATYSFGYTTPRKAVVATVNPNLPASVSIVASSSGAICSGTSVTFTATPTNGGTTPAYQWKLNGGNVGTNSATYINSALANDDIVTCVMTSNATCVIGSPATSNVVTMVVNPILAASINIAASPSGAICSDTSVTFTATPTNGGSTPSYQWKLNGGNVGTNSVTYTNPALANGDIVTCVMTSNATPCLTGSPATSNVVSMIVNTAPAVPVVPATLSIGCLATAFTANWTASDSATNYNFDVATDAGFSTVLPSYNNKALGNVISENVTGLTIGTTFYVRLRAENSCGTSANSTTIVVSIPTTTYNAGAWDNGVPDSNKKVVFSYFDITSPITTQLNACSCQINSGVNVVVGVAGALNDTAILKLENELNVMGSGTLTFENNASLVQVNDAAVNTGTIIYKRNTTPMKNYDYTYWSSPVAGQTLKALSPNTLSDKYFSFSMNSWVIELNGVNTMGVGKGYIIRVPKPDVLFPNGEYWTGTTYLQPVEFKGVPNNGVYSRPIDPVGYNNLIGNPYPCAMSADAFLLENSINNSRLEGTIYFWTHNTAIANGRYSGTDFASYNYLGGVGTGAAPSASTGGANTSVPSGYIAAGQSFLAISANGAGPVIFNNGMRVSSVNKNTQFFKGTKSKAASIEKNRIWLILTNKEGAFKQMLVGYATGATNGFDSAFDGVSLDSNKYIDFYSVNDNRNFVIQGRALPFDKTDKVPLGYKTSIDGTFEISIDQVDGILAGQTVFIEDKVTKVIHNLKNGAYSFSTSKGVFDDRFVLRYTDNSVVVTNPIMTNPVVADLKVLDPNKGRAVVVSVKDHQIKINSLDETIGMVMVYDLTGKLLYQNEHVNKNEFVIHNLKSSDQFLIVLTQLLNGKWITQEIVF